MVYEFGGKKALSWKMLYKLWEKALLWKEKKKLALNTHFNQQRKEFYQKLNQVTSRETLGKTGLCATDAVEAHITNCVPQPSDRCSRVSRTYTSYVCRCIEWVWTHLHRVLKEITINFLFENSDRVSRHLVRNTAQKVYRRVSLFHSKWANQFYKDE